MLENKDKSMYIVFDRNSCHLGYIHINIRREIRSLKIELKSTKLKLP